MNKKVDLNSDLGESFGAYKIGNDENVIPLITSANVACGWHAGDSLVMQKTVSLCKGAGIAVGAHPGYPDLMGFGRRALSVTPAEMKSYNMYQVGALQTFLRADGMTLQHVKPHGAMYNAAAKDIKLSRAICEAIAECAPGAILLCLSGSEMCRAAEECGIVYASEVFADRAYEDDGSLVARSKPGAVITDENEAIARVVRMVRESKVTSVNGKDISIKADSICVHGDNAHALEFVTRIRAALKAENISTAPLGDVISAR